jgi:hypothetical protein
MGSRLKQTSKELWTADTNTAKKSRTMKWTIFGALVAATSVNAQPGCTNAPAPAPAPNNKVPYIKVNLVKNEVGNAIERAVNKAFTDAAAKWSEIIVSDLPNIRMPQGADLQQQCGEGARIEAGTVVQNMIIFARVQTIDGPGKVLGSARPCLFSDVNGNTMPRAGVMTFDAADVANQIANGRFESTVLHEMGHIIGIGSGKWRERVAGKDTATPTYSGPLAVNGIKGFNAIGGKGVRVPVENDGGPGTALSHWDETAFKNELMTGFLSGQTQPISALTVNSLIDLGYQVNKNSAETFTMPVANAGNGRLLDEEHEHEHERMLAEGGWEEPTWPDISKEAAMLGEDGVYIAKTSQVEAEIQASVASSESGATGSSTGSSTGAIVGAAAGGALAMLAVVAVAANFRSKKSDAVAPGTMQSKYLEGQL